MHPLQKLMKWYFEADLEGDLTDQELMDEVANTDENTTTQVRHELWWSLHLTLKDNIKDIKNIKMFCLH